jgi:YihY family inner membrane protein
VPWLAFPVAVQKKFGDDQAGNLAALTAYYAFLAIFPLLLVLVTVLGLVLKHDPALRQKLISSALQAYPVIGPQLEKSVHALSGSGLALAIGLLGALFGARGVAVAMQNALGTVWAIPHDRRPGFPWSVIRPVGLVIVVGVGQMLTAFLSGVAGGIGHLVTGVGGEVATGLASFALNIGVFWLAFHLAAAAQVSWRDLRLAAILSAASWQILLLAGGLIVGHTLQHSSAIYGIFGVVLGLLAWLYLQAQITLYGLEAAAVRSLRLWPRGLAPEQATAADARAEATYVRGQRWAVPPQGEPAKAPEEPAAEAPGQHRRAS